MRKILFRGKRVDNGEWVEGFVALFDANNSYIIRRAEVLNSGGIRIIEKLKIDSKTIGQYTGLTDKNGKKIFEGDIVKIEKYLYRVYFDTSMACFEFCKICDNWDISFYKYADLSKIIGNIHDDPELLKGE